MATETWTWASQLKAWEELSKITREAPPPKSADDYIAETAAKMLAAPKPDPKKG